MPDFGGHVQRPVSAAYAPDYNDFVEPEDELCLEDVERKLKGVNYSSADEFRADIAQIVRNATAYNTPGHGQFGGPGVHVLLLIPRLLVQAGCGSGRALWGMVFVMTAGRLLLFWAIISVAPWAV